MTTATLPPILPTVLILPTVIDLVKQAGTWLAAEFARADGPRSSDTDTSPIDTEIELFLLLLKDSAAIHLAKCLNCLQCKVGEETNENSNKHD